MISCFVVEERERSDQKFERGFVLYQVGADLHVRRRDKQEINTNSTSVALLVPNLLEKTPWSM